MKKRADGRYCKQVIVGYYPDGRRRMKTVYGKTIKEVEKKEREVRDKLDTGIKVCEDLTVAQWCDIWLPTFKSNLAQNTYTRYEGIIRNQIKPAIGIFPLDKIRLDILQSTINDFAKTMAPATVKKIKDVIFQIFKQAVKAQYISFNPADGIDIPKLEQVDRTPIPEEHIKGISRFCSEYEKGAMIMTLLYTGMRRGELLAITADDIDFDTGVIRVRKSVEFIKDSPNIKLPKTKKSIRNIPILNPLLPYLKKATLGKKKNDFVFCNKKNELYGKTEIQRAMQEFNKKYNMYLQGSDNVYFTAHQFRHTFATLLYNAGVDVKTAQEILGHSSVNITLDVYTHLDSKFKKINTDKLNAYLSNSSLEIV